MPTKIISNQPYNLREYIGKLLSNSFLIGVLTKRELKIKYSLTFIGIGWVILQPLIVVTVYTIFFKNFIKLNTGEIPYPQFVLSGLVLWYLFTGIISKCTYSLLESGDLIHKVSFPKIIILFSKCIPVLIECLVLLVIAFFAMLITNQKVGIYSATSLFYFTQTFILAFSFGMLSSIVVLKYRDLAHVIPFLFNFGIWLTPVFYSVSIVPDQYKNILRFGNPLALSMEGMRGGLFQNQGISINAWLLFLSSSALLLASFFIFVKFEKRIVENL
jgi:lipopolysaccharide transport system permease protein